MVRRVRRYDVSDRKCGQGAKQSLDMSVFTSYRNAAPAAIKNAFLLYAHATWGFFLPLGQVTQSNPNAVGYISRAIYPVNHLYSHLILSRSQNTSSHDGSITTQCRL